MSETNGKVGSVTMNPQRIEVDWLTFTQKFEMDMTALRQLATIVVSQTRELGLKRSNWAWMGYEGERIGGVRYGERADGAILVLIGEYAAAYWRHLRGMVGRATRLDLAVDFHVAPHHNSDLAKWLYQSASEAWESDRIYSIVEGSRGGTTFYSGSRKSERMMRVYNKSAQMGNPNEVPTLWRAELELKGKRASNAWQGLSTQAHPEAMMAYEVRSHLIRWYLPMHLSAATILMNATPVKLVAVSPGKTLSWLKHQVSPAICRLIDQGYLEEAERALGYSLISFDSQERR